MSDIKRSSTLFQNGSVKSGMLHLIAKCWNWFLSTANDSTQRQIVQKQIDRFSMKATHSRKQHGIA